MGASGGGGPTAPAASAPPSPEPPQKPTDPTEPPQKPTDPTDPAAWLLTVLAGAVAGGITAAITNSLTAAFEHSPLLLVGVLGAGVLIAGLVYLRRDLHRALRRAWRLARARVRRRLDRRVEKSPSPILAPVATAVASAPDADEEDRPDVAALSRQWRVVGYVAAVTVAGGAAGYIAIGGGFARGRVTGTAVVAGLAAAVLLAIAWARYRGPGRLSWFRSLRHAMLAVGVAAVGLSAGGTLGAADLTPPAQCPPPTELRVLASTEILGPLQVAITAFETGERAALGGGSCYAIDITAYAADSDKAADDEVTGAWNLANGPRPDIWIPASSEELPGQPPGPGERHVVPLRSVASSPLVVAVQSNRAAKVLATANNASLADIYQQAATAGFAVALPNPRLSETGRLGIADLYPSLSTAQLAALTRLRGYPTDSADLLCQAVRAKPAQAKPTVYLVPAVTVSPSNDSLLDASGCASASAGSLTKISPASGSSSVLDFPFTTLDWTPAPPARAVSTAEQDFYRWLSDPGAGGLVLQQHGLGPPVPAAATYLPGADTIDAAVHSFTQSQPPARILVAIDDSALMQGYLREIEQAVDGVLGSQGQGGNLRAGRDSFGIWAFPGGQAGGAAEQRLVAVEPDTPGQRALVPGAVAGIRAHAHSAEFDLVAAAADRASGANSLVLLTDGDNQQVDPGGNSIVKVSGRLGYLAGQGAPFKVYVIAFGGNGCDETPSGSADSLTALAIVGGGRCDDEASGLAGLQRQLANDISTLSTGG